MYLSEETQTSVLRDTFVAHKWSRKLIPIITFSRGELLLLNAHTFIGVNQVIALEEKLTVVTQKLQSLEAKQALAAF